MPKSQKGISNQYTQGSTFDHSLSREVYPLDPQPHRHSMLVPRVCAPRVTRCRLGKYWWRNFLRKRLAGCWLESRHAQLVSRQFQSDPGPVTRAVPELDRLSRQPILGYTCYLWLIERQRYLMTHAQYPLPVYYSQVLASRASGSHLDTKTLKMTPQDTQLFLWGISKYVNLKHLFFFHLKIIPMTLNKDTMPYFNK